MKRQFQKLPNFPFFLAFSCVLTLLTMFLSYLSKPQNKGIIQKKRS